MITILKQAIKESMRAVKLQMERPCELCKNQFVVGNYGPCHRCGRMHKEFELLDPEMLELMRQLIFGEEEET